ncbi:queuosine precursor transporter [Reichenbachiella versicolor]|uniref:queuosine precursor transporter n=1 Tax=Reichenbachiella versicolor TaxID=1821036 RepID=UPI000D6DF5A4|nr:queuosine precursor transporter [Reichenbachiella versicolor]
MNQSFEDKKNTLFLVLAGIFITNALLAEIVGVKIFSLEKLLNTDPAQISLLGEFVLDFNLTAGVVLWPVVFICTDIINEYFGKSGVKKISFLTAGLVSFAFLMIYIITVLPPADFWVDINSVDKQGNSFNINSAFQTIFNQGLGIIVGSLVAFLIAQILDVTVFQKLRSITGPKMIWLRATGSTLFSQLIDSFVVLIIAFYIWGNWPLKQVIAVGIINYIYKFVIAMALTPFIYLGHYLIDSYLGKENAERLTEEASMSK